MKQTMEPYIIALLSRVPSGSTPLQRRCHLWSLSRQSRLTGAGWLMTTQWCYHAWEWGVVPTDHSCLSATLMMTDSEWRRYAGKWWSCWHAPTDLSVYVSDPGSCRWTPDH